jgi:hypothetical protein
MVFLSGETRSQWAKRVGVENLKKYYSGWGIYKVWNEDQVNFVKNNLQMTNSEIALRCGKNVIQLKNMMRRVGIKRDDELSRLVRGKVRKGKRLSELTRKKISYLVKMRIRTKEHCENISKSKKGVKFSEAHCIALRKPRRNMRWSEDGLKRIAEVRLGNKSRSGQIFSSEERMKSSWEVRFAEWCDKNGIKWKYEPKIFYLESGAYIPDFELVELGKWVEVKGELRKKSADKMNDFVGCGNSLVYVDNPVNIDLSRGWVRW